MQRSGSGGSLMDKYTITRKRARRITAAFFPNDPVHPPGHLDYPCVEGSRRAVSGKHQMVGCQMPLTYVASESPGQRGMEMQMNFRSTSEILRY